MSIVRLHRLSELRRYSISATDGEIGSLEEIYFDELTWTVRYFVVVTGTWLKGRRLLISTVAVGDVDEREGTLFVELPCSQIKGSPPMERGGSVSRRYETDYFRYYGWPAYWESAPYPHPLSAFGKAAALPAKSGRDQDSHLRSSLEVSGYRIAAEDGEIGHVADFVIDEKKWKLCYLEVDTRNWLPGKHVLLNPAWIKAIDWPQRSVIVDLRREDIQSAPAYDPKSVISHEYEIQLFGHYAKRKYRYGS